jgi:site-specific recombinase XerD
MTDLTGEFLTHHQAQGHSPGTVEWYSGQLTRFFRWLTDNELQHRDWLQTAVLESYIASSMAGGNSPVTAAGHYRALSGFFAWLLARNLIEKNPMDDVRKPKQPRKVPRRTGLDGYTMLVDSIKVDTWIGQRDRLIVSVLFLCGLRRGEVAHLEAGDFQMAAHLLHVRAGKGERDRFVPMLPAVERAFVAYIFSRPASQTNALFLAANGHNAPNGMGITAGAIYQMLRRRCRSAGLPVMNPHSFRHGMAMHLLNEGGDMSLTQRILGHSQITTTANIYAEWLTGPLAAEFTKRMGETGK